MTDLDPVEQLKSCSGSPFREFYEIYAASIAAREQKPEAWVCAMVRAPEHSVWVMKRAGHVRAFSILFLSPPRAVCAPRVHGGGARGAESRCGERIVQADRGAGGDAGRPQPSHLARGRL